jgi:hypothetical protein
MRVHVVCSTCDSKYWLTSRAQACQFTCRKCRTQIVVAAAQPVGPSGKCPSCGGPLGSNEGDSCEYCGIALPSKGPSSARAAPETIRTPMSAQQIATCAIIGGLTGVPAIYMAVDTLFADKLMSTTTTIVVSTGLLAFLSTIVWLLSRLPLLAIAAAGIPGLALALKPWVNPIRYTSGGTTRTLSLTAETHLWYLVTGCGFALFALLIAVNAPSRSKTPARKT